VRHALIKSVADSGKITIVEDDDDDDGDGKLTEVDLTSDAILRVGDLPATVERIAAESVVREWQGVFAWVVVRSTSRERRFLLLSQKAGKEKREKGGAWGGNWGRWSRPRMTSGDGWVFTHECGDADSRQAWFQVPALPLHRDAFLEGHRRLPG